MRKILCLIYLLVLFNKYSFAQKDNLSSLAVAAGVGIGLAAILNENGDNSQDYLESKMLDYVLNHETIKLPQTLKVSLINKPATKQDYIKANCFIFNVKGKEFGNFVYVMVLGNHNFRNSNGFDFKKLIYLKYDRSRWEQNGMEILKSLAVDKSNFITNNKIISMNSNSGKMDTLNFFNLKKIKDEYLTFSVKNGDGYETNSYLDKVLVAEDNHILFNLPPDLNHPTQKFIFDYSELQMNIFIPELGESIFFSNHEFVNISDALQ